MYRYTFHLTTKEPLTRGMGLNIGGILSAMRNATSVTTIDHETVQSNAQLASLVREIQPDLKPDKKSEYAFRLPEGIGFKFNHFWDHTPNGEYIRGRRAENVLTGLGYAFSPSDQQWRAPIKREDFERKVPLGLRYLVEIQHKNGENKSAHIAQTLANEFGVGVSARPENYEGPTYCAAPTPQIRPDAAQSTPQFREAYAMHPELARSAQNAQARFEREGYGIDPGRDDRADAVQYAFASGRRMGKSDFQKEFLRRWNAREAFVREYLAAAQREKGAKLDSTCNCRGCEGYRKDALDLWPEQIAVMRGLFVAGTDRLDRDTTSPAEAEAAETESLAYQVESARRQITQLSREMTEGLRRVDKDSEARGARIRDTIEQRFEALRRMIVASGTDTPTTPLSERISAVNNRIDVVAQRAGEERKKSYDALAEQIQHQGKITNDADQLLHNRVEALRNAIVTPGEPLPSVPLNERIHAGMRLIDAVIRDVSNIGKPDVPKR